MRRRVRRVSLILVSSLCVFGCSDSPKEDEAWLKGTVKTTSGYGISGVTVVARQLQPIEGYDRIEAETGPEGEFFLKGLYPSSQYELTLEGGIWDAYVATGDGLTESAPSGQTGLLPAAIEVSAAFTTSGAVINLYTGKVRFTKSADGVITDSVEGFQWYPKGQPAGADAIDSLFRWAAQLEVDGGGWALPKSGHVLSLYNESYPNHIGLAFRDVVETEFKAIFTDKLRDSESSGSDVYVVDFRDGKYKWLTPQGGIQAFPYAIRRSADFDEIWSLYNLR